MKYYSKKNSLNVLKKSIWLKLISTIKIGQKVTILLLMRGVNLKMRIISYAGLVTAFNKSKSNFFVTLTGLAFSYNFFISLKLTSLNVVRFIIQ